MKTTPKSDPSQRLVRHALVNIFFFPGLGTIGAKRYASGIGQIIIFLAGAVALMVWVYKILEQYYGLMFQDVKVQPIGWIGITGGTLMILAWLWSLVSSFGIFSEVSKAQNQLLTPPILASVPAVKLAEPQIAEVLASLPNWQRNGLVISRTYEFADFVTAMAFVNAVARIAEQVQHHPDVDIRWNKVTLALTTHDTGGLTQKDFSLARECDRFAVR